MFWFTLLLLPSFSVAVQNLGTPLTRDGIGSLQGYTDTVYQAVRFIPVCGTLATTNTVPIDITEICSPAMNSYNRTTDTFAFYDTTGVKSPYIPATGSDGCLCFSLGMLIAGQGDFCIWMSGAGQPDVQWSLTYNYIVSGSFAPGGKSLPQCNNVDVAAISASVYAAAQPTGTTVVGGGNTTNTTNQFPTQTAPTRAPISSSTETPSPDSKSGLGSGSIAGTVVGIVVFIIIIGACARGWRGSSSSSSSNWVYSEHVVGAWHRT